MALTRCSIACRNIGGRGKGGRGKRGGGGVWMTIQMGPHGVGPQLRHESGSVPATIGICHVQ